MMERVRALGGAPYTARQATYSMTSPFLGFSRRSFG
jgi:hypothetical protein